VACFDKKSGGEAFFPPVLCSAPERNLTMNTIANLLKPKNARQRATRTQTVRHIVQLLFVAFIIYSAVVHNLATADATTASTDALCPFGGLETVWKYVTTGQFLPHTHASDIVLGLGLLIGVLLAGGAFCSWVCPFGAVQDFLTWVRKLVRLPELRVPDKLDRVLRYGRFLVLGLILYQTVTTVTLWFSTFDPYRTLFGLEWLFAYDPLLWLTYTILLVVLVASLFVERAWCRYACPLGGAISLLGNFSLLRIRRDAGACKDCAICEKECPVKLPVATSTTVSANCIGCLNCVETCPANGGAKGALEVRLQPTWLPGPKAQKPKVSNAR
jgi:polyferredoxin